MRLEPVVTAVAADAPASAGPRPQANPGPGAGFGQVLSQAQAAAPAPAVVVQRGDTLIGLVKAHQRQAGQPVSEIQAFRLAQQVARDNGIANPNLILTGQSVNFSSLGLPALVRSPGAALAAMPTSQAWVASRQAASAVSVAERPALSAGPHPVLERTLERAVQKGFVPAHEVDAVRQRIGRLSQDHGFAPDDFALLTLMESDGMNPQASNGRCHGIIQFCDGEGRGAASVGMGQTPRAILGMGVLQQLDLVDRYFKDTGLRQYGPNASVDDLYLTVLTPAARSERRRDVPLGIPGQQASYLYVDRQRGNAITRDSLVAGLHHNAGLRLGVDTRSLAQAVGRPGQWALAGVR
jgi:hypothetical protein